MEFEPIQTLSQSSVCRCQCQWRERAIYFLVTHYLGLTAWRLSAVLWNYYPLASLTTLLPPVVHAITSLAMRWSEMLHITITACVKLDTLKPLTAVAFCSTKPWPSVCRLCALDLAFLLLEPGLLVSQFWSFLKLLNLCLSPPYTCALVWFGLVFGCQVQSTPMYSILWLQPHDVCNNICNHDSAVIWSFPLGKNHFFIYLYV